MKMRITFDEPWREKEKQNIQIQMIHEFSLSRIEFVFFSLGPTK